MDQIREINKKILQINNEIKELYGRMDKLEKEQLKSDRDQRNIGIVINNLETCGLNLLSLKASTLIKINRAGPVEEIDR